MKEYPPTEQILLSLRLEYEGVPRAGPVQPPGPVHEVVAVGQPGVVGTGLWVAMTERN